MKPITPTEAFVLRQNAEARGGYWSSLDTWTKPHPSPYPTTVKAKRKAAEANAKAMSTFSPLLDMAPVEIRLMIFRLVLRAEVSLEKVARRVKGAGEKKRQTLFKVSLLRVNRQVGLEARDAFFDVNTIRLSQFEDKHFYLDDLRQVELTGDIASSICRPHSYMSFKTFATIPRLRSMTVACDTLAHPWQSVRWFLRDQVDRRIEVWCPELGVYELEVPFKTNADIYFKHFSLTSALPTAKAMAAQMRRKVIAGECIGSQHANMTSSGSVDMFAHWLACYEAMRVLKADPSTNELTAEEISDVEDFEVDYLDTTVVDPSGADLISDGALLTDLTPAKHGDLLMHWATELLAFHLADMDQYFLQARDD